MSNQSEQCAPNQLWYPGLHLDDEYPVPTDAELEAAWSAYRPDEKAHALQGVYGVYSEPTTKIKAIASIDLCEVVRDTVGGFDEATGTHVYGKRNLYTRGTWFDGGEKGMDYERSVVVSVIQVLMSEGHIQSDPHAGAMAAFLRNWRKQGIYTVANTSTLPGCEIGTINNTLARDLAGSFDALVLPRNHDGLGPITKAGALAILAEEASIDISDMPLIHIDDADHHIAGFQNHFESSPRMQLFVPRHRDNGSTPVDMHCKTPLEAFIRADQHFASEGVVHAR